MLYRKFDPDFIYRKFVHKKYGNIDKWREAARLGTQILADWKIAHQISKKGDRLPVDTAICGALKQCLKAHFFGKCAYCESEFDSVAWGDVEHYRPKRSVHEEPNH